MEFLEPIIISITASLTACSGFFTFLLKRRDKIAVNHRLLLGIAHDRIAHVAMSHISKGYVTVEEYRMLERYLYKPYKEAGGNGTIDLIMRELSELPFIENQIREGPK